MRFAVFATPLLSLCLQVAAPAQELVKLSTDAKQEINRIDEKVYGHFLEHIYHSCNGGLWGELVWNRSFEQNDAGQWAVEDGCVAQASRGTNVRLVFGDPTWTDYEYTLEARKTGGQEGFLILFRVAGEQDFYWVNLGGWGNQRHQIERGRAGEQRWHAVGPARDGAIKKGQWYRIQVRCEGRKISVKLDGEPVIDFVDDQGAVTKGAVGIGTWATQAQFRNLKVVSLDGKTLFEGMPKSQDEPVTAKLWSGYGAGRITLDTDNPLNSRFAQRITGESGETGLSQTGLALHAGTKYEGSFWARGRASEGLVVRLVDGPETLAEAKLEAPADTWKSFDFALTVPRAAERAAIQVGARGQSSVWIDQVSLMPADWAKEGGFRPDLLEAIRGLRPPVIRWPGGCFASAYRWKDGIGPQHKRVVYPIEIWDDRDVNSMGTDEFVAMCRRVNAEPLIVVNIGTPAWRGDDDEAVYQQDVLDWIEYCNGPATSRWGRVRAENGHAEPYNVKYWEIDNETWHMGADVYAEAVCRIAPLMKKADPSIQLAACGSAGYGDDANGLQWNRTIIERCGPLVDFLSIHHYESPDLFAEGPRKYEEFFRKTGDLIKKSHNPQLKIYVSEWNAQSTDWRTGLYAGGLLNAFERCGDVLEIGGPALFLRHVSATDWDNAFVNFDNRSWFPAPNYIVMQLWREHYAPTRVDLQGDASGINAVATKSEDGKRLYLKAVNPGDSARDVEWTLANFPVAEAGMKIVAPDSLKSRNTLGDPRAVGSADGKVDVSGATVKFRLPRWSAAVVELRCR